MSDVKTLLEALKDLSKEDVEKALSVLENRQEEKEDVKYVLIDAKKSLRDMEVARELITDAIHAFNALIEEIEESMNIHDEVEEALQKRDNALLPPLTKRPTDRGVKVIIGEKPRDE